MKISKRFMLLFLVPFGFSNKVSAQEEQQNFRKDGVYFGVYTGTWFGIGKNAVLRNNIMSGLLLELKSEKSALGFNFDFFGNITMLLTCYLLMGINKYQ